MLYSVDRIENGVVILIGDDGSCMAMRSDMTDSLLHEGDIVAVKGGKTVIDAEETKRRRSRNYDRLQRLFGEKNSIVRGDRH